MTDFRALLADDAFAASFQSLGQYRTALLVALAQPEPQGPTDECMRETFREIAELFEDYLDNAGYGGEYLYDKLEYARAVLTRWARPAIKPDGAAQPEPVERPIWTEGICGDGAAILKDGVMQPIESVIAALNAVEHTHPEPQGVTHETLQEAADLYDYTYRESAGMPHTGFGPARGTEHHQAGLHAVLARWGRTAIEPVPVGERMPKPEDCDTEGRCWLLTVEDDYPQWRLHSIQGAQPGGYMIWVPVDNDGSMVDCFYTSHWLPAHALPVPQQEGE